MMHPWSSSRGCNTSALVTVTVTDRPMLKNNMWMFDIQTGFIVELSMFIFLVPVTHNDANGTW